MNHPLLHVANVLYLISYSVKDVLWLRGLMIVAMCCLAYCYYICHEFVPIYWQTAFIAINLFHVGLLIRERRPVQLSVEEQQLHAGPLRTLSPRQVRRLVDLASWREAAAGERIVAQGEDLDRLILLYAGDVAVRVDGAPIATMCGGHFAGEMSYLTGGAATADVVAAGPIRYLEWPERFVVELGERDAELATALQAALGGDLVRKLLATRSVPAAS